MYQYLEPGEYLKAANKYPVLDVRSPAEFELGHIPGAYNLPLFSNEERAVVGTLYKKQSRRAAILKGLEFTGPKLADFASFGLDLAVENRVLIHCWRGGMRSSGMAWLLNTASLEVSVLKGGYKAYRARFRALLDVVPWQFIVLGGPTGSGKTEVLHELARSGAQVLDLEGIAHHKGSAFGALGQAPQPSNEQFENNLHQAFNAFNPSVPVWVEGESHNIGRICVPDNLFNKLQSAPLVMFNLPKENRIDRLMNEYGGFDNEELKGSVLKIKKRLGGLQVKEALEALEENNLRKVADITLSYYDKSYAHSLARRRPPVYSYNSLKDNPVESARHLAEWVANNTFEMRKSVIE